ncbi:MAG: SPFH domain-containing protein, partial [bacterium]|nr:SPFH domain-containing protein [bacterium]
MKNNKIILLVSMVLLFAVILTGCHTTGPTEIGVRTRKIGIFAKRGVEEKMYAPGSTFIFLPVINDWHTFDTKLYNMEMTYDPSKGDIKDRDDLLFKTIDGNDISLDVIISFRIDPQKGPYILQHVAKDDDDLRKFIVRTIARSKPRDIFGELKTEEFYVAEKRQQKSESAKDILNGILNPYGVIVERVLTKDYRFPPAYQAAIEERKVADQIAEKNKS